MAEQREKPTQQTEKGRDVPVPKREDWPVPNREDRDAMLDKVITPAREGPPEIEDAAREEMEIPADETDEG
jgi:hypothetical protein